MVCGATYRLSLLWSAARQGGRRYRDLVVFGWLLVAIVAVRRSVTTEQRGNAFNSMGYVCEQNGVLGELLAESRVHPAVS